MSKLHHKIGLGTVQFGLNYGISNQTGMIDEQEAALILSSFQKKGGQLIDTAPAYGNSEAVVGRLIANCEDMNVISKSCILTGNDQLESLVKKLEATFEKSLENLQVTELYAILVHHCDDLEKPGVVDWLISLKERGLVQKIGVSVYTAQDIDRVLTYILPDIVQLPFNIADQRLLKSGHIAELKSRAVEIHVRSLFLQGLLLMPLEKIDIYFDPIKPFIKKIHAFADELSVLPVHLCTHFVLSNPLIDFGLVGVSCYSEWDEISRGIDQLSEKEIEYPSCPDLFSQILNPSNWPKK